MRPALLALPLLVTACSFPQFVASKTVELEIPLEQATALQCRTHNGDITVSHGPDGQHVIVQAELKVRGFTQEEADDNLATMSLRHAVESGALQLIRDYPKSRLNGRSPTYTYTLTVPEHLALDLRSHNGDILTSGTKGSLTVRTHNGDIETWVDNPNVEIGTHNGDVQLEIASRGRLEGSVETHNGDVRVSLHEDASCWIEARTHNGRIDPPAEIHDATIKKRSLRCRVGRQQTDGKLRVRTHNGSVRID